MRRLMLPERNQEPCRSGTQELNVPDLETECKQFKNAAIDCGNVYIILY